jgi:hypothetical protein
MNSKTTNRLSEAIAWMREQSYIGAEDYYINEATLLYRLNQTEQNLLRVKFCND